MTTIEQLIEDIHLFIPFRQIKPQLLQFNSEISGKIWTLEILICNMNELITTFLSQDSLQISTFFPKFIQKKCENNNTKIKRYCYIFLLSLRAHSLTYSSVALYKDLFEIGDDIEIYNFFNETKNLCLSEKLIDNQRYSNFDNLYLNDKQWQFIVNKTLNYNIDQIKAFHNSMQQKIQQIRYKTNEKITKYIRKDQLNLTFFLSECMEKFVTLHNQILEKKQDDLLQYKENVKNELRSEYNHIIRNISAAKVTNLLINEELEEDQIKNENERKKEQKQRLIAELKESVRKSNYYKIAALKLLIYMNRFDPELDKIKEKFQKIRQTFLTIKKDHMQTKVYDQLYSECDYLMKQILDRGSEVNTKTFAECKKSFNPENTFEFNKIYEREHEQRPAIVAKIEELRKIIFDQRFSVATDNQLKNLNKIRDDMKQLFDKYDRAHNSDYVILEAIYKSSNSNSEQQASSGNFLDGVAENFLNSLNKSGGGGNYITIDDQGRPSMQSKNHEIEENMSKNVRSDVMEDPHEYIAKIDQEADLLERQRIISLKKSAGKNEFEGNGKKASGDEKFSWLDLDSSIPFSSQSRFKNDFFIKKKGHDQSFQDDLLPARKQTGSYYDHTKDRDMKSLTGNFDIKENNDFLMPVVAEMPEQEDEKTKSKRTGLSQIVKDDKNKEQKLSNNHEKDLIEEKNRKFLENLKDELSGQADLPRNNVHIPKKEVISQKNMEGIEKAKIENDFEKTKHSKIDDLQTKYQPSSIGKLGSLKTKLPENDISRENVIQSKSDLPEFKISDIKPYDDIPIIRLNSHGSDQNSHELNNIKKQHSLETNIFPKNSVNDKTPAEIQKEKIKALQNRFQETYMQNSPSVVADLKRRETSKDKNIENEKHLIDIHEKNQNLIKNNNNHSENKDIQSNYAQNQKLSNIPRESLVLEIENLRKKLENANERLSGSIRIEELGDSRFENESLRRESLDFINPDKKPTPHRGSLDMNFQKKSGADNYPNIGETAEEIRKSVQQSERNHAQNQKANNNSDRSSIQIQDARESVNKSLHKNESTIAKNDLVEENVKKMSIGKASLPKKSSNPVDQISIHNDQTNNDKDNTINLFNSFGHIITKDNENEEEAQKPTRKTTIDNNELYSLLNNLKDESPLIMNPWKKQQNNEVLAHSSNKPLNHQKDEDHINNRESMQKNINHDKNADIHDNQQLSKQSISSKKSDRPIDLEKSQNNRNSDINKSITSEKKASIQKNDHLEDNRKTSHQELNHPKNVDSDKNLPLKKESVVEADYDSNQHEIRDPKIKIKFRNLESEVYDSPPNNHSASMSFRDNSKNDDFHKSNPNMYENNANIEQKRDMKISNNNPEETFINFADFKNNLEHANEQLNYSGDMDNTLFPSDKKISPQLDLVNKGNSQNKSRDSLRNDTTKMLASNLDVSAPKIENNNVSKSDVPVKSHVAEGVRSIYTKKGQKLAMATGLKTDDPKSLNGYFKDFFGKKKPT